jgi:branched-chain amino acid transport system substrate-binding protein
MMNRLPIQTVTKRSWMIAIAALAIGAIVAIGMALRPPVPTSIRIGYAISLTGPNAPGADITVLPNYRLWAKEVNEAGGLMVSSLGKRLPVEVIEYDDRSEADKAVEMVAHLINEDKVDFLFPPWGTGLNLAVGPLFHSAGYPHLAVTALTHRAPELAKLWPNSFWLLGTMTDAAQALAATLDTLRSENKITKTVAIVSVADQFGIEFAKAARRALEKHGFEIIYDRSYAVGFDDLRPIIAEAKQLSPDSFLAFSYPPDTLAITEDSRAAHFNPKVFYTAVGTAFSLYKQRFGSDIEGVMGTGGWNPDTPESRGYLKRHLAATGHEPDGWASPITYASLQMLQQAIERVGKIDRAAVIEELQEGTFETIVGKVQLRNHVYDKAWWVGQWQDGFFHGIAPATLPGARPVMFPKPAWHADG